MVAPTYILKPLWLNGNGKLVFQVHIASDPESKPRKYTPESFCNDAPVAIFTIDPDDWTDITAEKVGGLFTD